ncbi:hypothetical protein ACFQ9X_12090 [Catenulispora yoronensis]
MNETQGGWPTSPRRRSGTPGLIQPMAWVKYPNRSGPPLAHSTR